MKKAGFKICSKGLWDTSIPDISFDDEGVSNYYHMFQRLQDEFPRGKKGTERWGKIVKTIREKGNSDKYDCVIGLSGGTDSCYLLHKAVTEWGLRPLAVCLDNGWSSDISVSNIKKLVTQLNVDLETYVIDYEEVKSVLTAYMKAGIPWIDGPTDRAIKSCLYNMAAKEGIKTILVGTDFRSEGKQPAEWTHNDSKMFNYIVKKFSSIKLKSYPKMSLLKQLYYGGVKKINRYQPFYFVDYNKNDAQKYLIEKYNWKYYGGHHHENLFTKFAIAHWLYEKFNIDKRIITLSAQVVSGDKDRDEALEELKRKPYEEKQLTIDKSIVIKKLGLTRQEFQTIWGQPNKTFHNYPSHYNFYMKYSKYIKKYYFLFMPTRPKMIVVKDG